MDGIDAVIARVPSVKMNADPRHAAAGDTTAGRTSDRTPDQARTIVAVRPTHVGSDARVSID
jgi:hypothetical protein